MPEILSQNQIDELLRKLSGDEVDGEEPADEDQGDIKVKLYNFKNPKKLTRDQQKVLRGISEIFARHLASYLAGLTRSYCEVSVVSLEEQPYMEYNNALPDMLITGVLDMNILKGALLLDFSNPITFALIERMFGGSMSAREVPSREFTDIETTLMERILKRITVLFQEAWSYPPNVSVSVRQVETNTRFIKAIAMDEVVVVMVLSVRLNTVKGTISCCIPCIGIGQTLDEILSAQEGRGHTMVTDDDSEEETQKAVLTQLEGSDIDFRGVLGTATITMEEMINLQVGDVIRLDQSVGTPIQISVNGKNWFLGEPGIKKNKVAVLITQQYAG
jgi:flagellar motor switch protein FliM